MVIHNRLCYIPIMLGGLWFGIYGGIGTAFAISIAITPFIVLYHTSMYNGFLSDELIEIVFYLFIGWIIGMLSTAQRKEREKNDLLKEQLKNSEKLSTIGEIFAYMMHEIKNPLNAIKGTADIIADSSVESQKKLEFSNILKNEIQRLNRTLDSMLGYTKLNLTLTYCDIGEELNTTLKMLAPQAEKTGVKMQLFGINNFQVIVDCDKIKQVFINLVLNAFDAMKNGGLLNISLQQSANGYIDIAFKDTGQGILPENMKKLFKPFFTTKSHGTGLGLAISKRIVEEHNGKLLVENEYGNGTSFIVRLPCN
ncbi:MAG: ATP-binding protein [Deltaproteobacteria bacterium]|nr:ATP-binding protein [Deltaproteobacteria bacterium]